MYGGCLQNILFWFLSTQLAFVSRPTYPVMEIDFRSYAAIKLSANYEPQWSAAQYHAVEFSHCHFCGLWRAELNEPV